MMTMWVPEAPDFPGMYAHELYPHQNNTYNFYLALRFKTKEACAAWCAMNPYPVFVPVEHCFSE